MEINMTEIRSKKKTPQDLAKLPIIGKKPQSEKEEKYLRELVEYEFYNLEEPGLTHKFSYGDTNNSHTFEFWHGGKYKLPRFVAHFLESKGTPIWDWRPDGSGRMNKKLVGKKPRFRLSQNFN
jgi:hypothetical protein